MKMSCPCLLAVLGATIALAGCQSFDASVFGGSFGRNSSAMTGGGAVAGQDYVIGLKPSEAAQQYFASASASDAKMVTVTPGDDKGTGVTWTDDGGITIPPGVTIEFTNKGCCLDPHLPAPKADEEMQFIKTSCLIPAQLQGTYKNLLRRAAAGDEDVKSNLQHLMWTLRTAGSNDAYAKNLTDRQREILAECAEAGSFDGYCQDLQRFDGLKKLVMSQVDQVADKFQIEVGNVTYKVTDLLDPELGKQKVVAHLGELIHMNEYLPVVKSGFNFGELQKGIYTDIKGNGTLSFKAKVANSTSEPFVFYPMDYVAQVGSGQNMQGAFFAAADNSMKQRTTTGEQCEVDAKETGKTRQPVNSDYQKRQNVADYFNRWLAKFPGDLPQITAEMIQIDPNRLKEMGVNAEMAYDADNNKFIVKRDISDFGILDYLGALFLVGGYSNIDRTANAACHEIGHYYQDVMEERNPSLYVKMADNRILAEGFAVIMGMRVSNGNGALAEHKNQIIEGTSSCVSYVEAAAQYVERLHQVTGDRSLLNIVNRIRSVETGFNAHGQSSIANDELAKIPIDKLVMGIRTLDNE